MPSVESKMYNMINATIDAYYIQLKEAHEDRKVLKDDQTLEYARLTGRIDAIQMFIRTLETMKY